MERQSPGVPEDGGAPRARSLRPSQADVSAPGRTVAGSGSRRTRRALAVAGALVVAFLPATRVALALDAPGSDPWEVAGPALAPERPVRLEMGAAAEPRSPSRDPELSSREAVAPWTSGNATWEVARVLEAPGRTYVHLWPRVDGLTVFGPRLTCVWNGAGRLLEIRGRTVELPASPRARHAIDPARARISATADIPAPALDGWILEEREWLVLDHDGGPELVPIFRLQFSTRSPSAVYESWVDAASGALLSRERLTRHVSGRISLEIEESTAGDPLLLVPAPEANVTLRRVDTGDRISTVTDAAGGFAFSPDAGTSFVVRTELAGPRIRVRAGNLGFASPADSTVAALGDTVSFSWGETEATRSARDAFHHGNVAYAFARSLDSGNALAPLDAGIDLRVDDGQGSCNAYWDGTRLTFYAAGGGCVATARIADVVYHEYGHAVTTQIYRPFRPPRDMDEAYSDYFAAAITGEPEIGQGIFGVPGTFLREIATDRVWPVDANVSPHLQGLILAGALWDLRAAIGAEAADSLFHYARYALPESFDEYFLDLLSYDDDDGDLTNGSPHFAAIVGAFRSHGIGDYSVRIEAAPLPDVEDPGEELAAPVVVRSLLGLDPDSLAFQYRLSDQSAFQRVALSPGQSTRTFVARFPAPPSGSTIEYYWSAADTAGTAARLPAGAPAEFYSFSVGPDRIAPELAHAPIEFLTPDQVDVQFEATSRDNSGRLATVEVEYRLEGQGSALSAPLQRREGDLYRAEVPIGPFSPGAGLLYRILAVDGSLGANTTAFPPAGEQDVTVRAGSTLGLEASDGGLLATGDWEWGSPSEIDPPPFGTRVWATRLDGWYSPLAESDLVWGPIEVDATGPRRLEFRHWHDFLAGIDGGQILVSTNGQSWSVAAPAEGYGYAEVAAFGDAAFSGRSDGWQRVVVALDRYRGSRIWIRWRMRAVGAVQAPGWYLDDLQVVSAQARLAPIEFTAGSGESERVALSWRAPRGIETGDPAFLGYRLYRAPAGEPYDPLPWRDGLRQTRVDDRDVENGVSYRYRLHAVYGEGESPGVERTARPAAPVFAFPADEIELRLAGTSRSDTTLSVTNPGEGILECNAYLATPDMTLEETRIRVDLETLGEEMVTVYTDPADAAGNPDLASIRMARSRGESDLLRIEVAGHFPWGDPLEDWGGLLLLDTDLDLATGPDRSIFGWDENRNIGWDAGVLFGRLARDQGSSAEGLFFRADALDVLTPVGEPSFPEGGREISFSLPLAELGDPLAVEISLLLARSRLSPPFDRAPERPALGWIEREPRHLRIRPGETRLFSLEFDATALGNGVHEARLYLSSNDPAAPELDLPVRLVVSDIVPADLDTRSFRSLDLGLEIAFATPRGLEATAAIVERSPLGTPVWTVLTPQPLQPDDGGLFLFVDTGAVPGTSYLYRIRMTFEGLPGAYAFGPYEVAFRPPTPREIGLFLAGPNPFRGSTELRLDVPAESQAAVEIYAVDGRKVATLFAGTLPAGQHPLPWSGAGGSGVYWVRASLAGLGTRVLRLVELE